MGFNQFTNPMAQNDLYKPLSEETFQQGSKAMYDRADRSAQAIGAKHNQLFNIATYGKDAEILAEFEQDFQNQVAELSKQGLDRPESVSRINTLIGKYSTNPDVLAVHQRHNAYASELEAKKEAESKGRSYVSPLLRQANKYYSGDKYYRDEKFNKSGFVAPENKELNEAFKAVPEYETWVKNGAYDDHLKGKALGALSSKALNLFQTDPQWRALHKDNFEQSIEGQDIFSYVDNPTNTVATLFTHLPKELQPKAEEYIKGLQSLKNNPYGESSIKAAMENLYLQDQAYMAAEAHTYSNTVDHKVNELTKDAIDFQQAKQLEVYKAIIPGALALGVSPESIINGTAKDAQGNIITVDKAIQKAQDFKVQEAQAKQDIKTEAAKTVDDYKTANKIEYKTKTGNTIGIKSDGAKQIKLGSDFVDKKAVEDQIKGGDKSTIEKFINSKGHLFGLGDNTIDPEQVWNGGIRFETDKKTGVEYVVYNDDAVFEETFKVPVSELVKALYDNDYKPGVIDSKGKYVNGNSLDVKVDQSNVSEYVTPNGQEVDVEGYTQEQIDQAIQNGVIKPK